MVERVGQIIGNYRIESLLGVGGMGQVFLGAHLHLNRQAAIKIMHSHLEVDPGFRERFVREARSAAALSHPNIVETYDFGEQDGLFYLVMEAVVDGSLTTLLHPPAGSGDELELRVGLDLVRQAAEGLAHAHAQGMVHRDVKPDNLLLKRVDDAYQTKVCDFGLVRIVEGSAATAAGMMMGTPVYMSPEQCQGLTLDSRSDQYSLGIVLFEVATGRRPFDASTPADILFQHINEAPPSPRSIRPELSSDLSAIIERCLAKQPEERFPTTEGLVSALRTVQAALDTEYARLTVQFVPPASVASQAAIQLEGRQIGRYRIDAFQTAGALTWDYLAFHTGLEMAVVFKVLRPELAGDAALAEAFQREVRLAAGMRHPGLVEVMDSGVAEEFAFVVLDATEGRTLRRELQRRRLSPAEVLACLSQIADAQDYAHTNGAAPRDVQPDTIMLTGDGTAVLLDIGDVFLARQRERAHIPADASRVPYVAPELAQDDADAARAGVYALGCLAYELLAGAPPFSRASSADTPAGEMSDPRLGLMAGAPALAPLVGTVIARALARSPEDRYASGAEFVQVLTAALTDDSSAPPSVNAMAAAGAHTPTNLSTVPSFGSTPPTVPPPGAVDSVPVGATSIGSSTLAPARRSPQLRYGAIALVAALAIAAAFWFLRDDEGGAGEPPTTTAASLSGSDATATALAAIAATADGTSTTAAVTATTPPATETTFAAIAASATAQAAATPTTEPSPTITPSPTVAATPTFDVFAAMRNGLIAFVTGRRPDNANIPDVYVMAPDGSDQRRLLTIAAADAYPSSDPAWSSDGTRLAFTSSRDGNNEIYTMGVDGADLNNITRSQAADAQPDWSPDDSLIVFESNRDGNVEVYVMDANGGNPRNLSNAPGTDWGPDWSPDGTKIVFVSDRNGANQIFIMNPDGSGLQALTSEPGAQDYNPAWSPDGTTIAFARNPGDEFHIFLMNHDGTNVRQITANAGQDSTPTWSPDGTQILFRGTRDGNADVYVMNADGSDQRRLTDNPTYDGSASWAPIPTE